MAVATVKKTPKTAAKKAVKKPVAKKAAARKTTAKKAAPKTAPVLTPVEKIRTQVEDVVSAVREAGRAPVEVLTQSREAAFEGALAANLKAIDFAEKNTAASFKNARKVLKADTARHALEIQGEFLKGAVKTYGDQVKVIGNMYAKTARQTVEPFADRATIVADKVKDLRAA